MKRSLAWFKGNVRQDVLIRGKSVVVQSTTNRTTHTSVKQPRRTLPSPFVVGESLVGPRLR